jgi:hypothetical protein
MAKTNPLCVQCARSETKGKKGSDKKTTTCVRTCWDVLTAAEENTRIIDGVVWTRDAKCSQWAARSFAMSGPVYSLNEGVFVKNYNTRVLEVPKIPALPPIVSFPGITVSMNQNSSINYDNTTCKGRCCKLVMVTRSLVNRGCDDDVDVCTSAYTGYSGPLPMCVDDASALECTAWVPCKPNSRLEFWILFAIILAAWLVLFVVGICGVETGHPTVMQYSQSVFFMWIASIIALLGAFIAIVADSDYSYWVANTSVDKDYASYQSCVAYCVSALKETYVRDFKGIAMNMCRDGGMHNNSLAIWPADINPYIDPNQECVLGESNTDPYCLSCLSVAGDWKKTRDAAYFMRVKSYIVIVICLFHAAAEIMYCYALPMRDGRTHQSILATTFYYVSAATALFYIACFVSSCVFLAPLVRKFGEINLVQDILAMQGGGIPIIAICGAYVAIDLVCGILFYVYGMGWVG